MVDPVLAHLDRILGQGGRYPGTELSRADGVAVLGYIDPEREAVHCVTYGLSQAPVRSLYPTELVCTVRGEQIEAARFLLESAVRLAVHRGTDLVLGSVISNATPLLTGTDIRGVLLTTTLWFEEDLDFLRDENGTIQLQVITMLPITGGDVTAYQDRGRQVLEDAIETNTVNLMDITRGQMV